MSLQFNRQYSLIVGDYRNGKGLKFTDHQITFNVSKSSSNKDRSNSASIEIYNLSKDELRVFDTEYLALALDVGYKGRASIPGIPLTRLFSGEVVQMTTKKSGTDIITQLILGSGYTDLNLSKVSETVPSGTKVKDVVDKVVKNMPGVSRGVVTGTNCNNPIIYGYPMSGSARQILDELCAANDMEWHVDNDVLYVSDSRRAINTKNTAFVLNQSSGLIDTPFFTIGGREHRKPKDGEAKKKEFVRQGVNFSALLNPAIVPGRIIKLEHEDVSGYYKISSAQYHGDYRGNDWIMEGYCSLVAEEEEENATA